MAKQNGPGGHTSLNVWPLNWRWGRAGVRAQGVPETPQKPEPSEQRRSLSLAHGRLTSGFVP